MDEVYYPKKTLEKFTRDMLGEGKSKSTDKNVEHVVYVLVTNILRDVILDIVGELTCYMKPWGDLIVTGGEAFNNYFDVDDRIISSDIDTKFVPHGSPRDRKFFGYLQYAKLDLWNYLGKIAKKYTPIIKDRIRRLSRTNFGKYLGISTPKNVTRRYTLIEKSTRKKVLIDVELFALDIKLKYFSPSEKKVIFHNLGGILDIAFMRPNEIGYEVVFTRDRGIVYRNPVTKMIRYNNNILIASKKFLVEDLYLMKQLGLRPKKAKKDNKRIFMFAKKILKINDINSKTPIDTVLKKSLEKLDTEGYKKVVTRSYEKSQKMRIKKIEKMNPNNYKEYTTPSSIQKVLQFHRPGLTNVTKFSSYRTNSEMYFNKNVRNWRMSKNPFYVKNIYTFRNKKPQLKTQRVLPYENTLYSYNKNRNNWVPLKIIRKSAMIPYVGLKNTELNKLVK